MAKPVKTSLKDMLNDIFPQAPAGMAGVTDVARQPQRDNAPSRAGGGGQAGRPLPGATMNRAQAARAARDGASRVRWTHESMEFMNSVMADQQADIIDNAEARAQLNPPGDEVTEGVEPVPPTTENLPALISRAVQVDHGGFTPKWMQVKQLPGYQFSQIRRLGRAVFSSFTKTALEDMQILSTVTNKEIEVRAMMAWIRKNGIRDDEALLSFGAVDAQTGLWKTKDYTFLVVRDFSGYHVFGWAGGRGVALKNDARGLLAGPEPEAENNAGGPRMR